MENKKGERKCFYNNFTFYIVNITVTFGIWTSSHQSSEWENTDVGPWGGWFGDLKTGHPQLCTLQCKASRKTETQIEVCALAWGHTERWRIPMWWLVWNPTPEWIKLKGEASRGSLQPRAFLKRLPGELSEPLCRLPSDALLALLGISLFSFGVALKGPASLGTTWIAFRFVGSGAACVSDSIWTDWLWMGW